MSSAINNRPGAFALLSVRCWFGEIRLKCRCENSRCCSSRRLIALLNRAGLPHIAAIHGCWPGLGATMAHLPRHKQNIVLAISSWSWLPYRPSARICCASELRDLRPRQLESELQANPAAACAGKHCGYQRFKKDGQCRRFLVPIIQ